MMISRRPNSLASTENAPGPRQTRAALTAIAKTTDSRVSKKLAEGVMEEAAAAMTPTPQRTEASGVRAPINNALPITDTY